MGKGSNKIQGAKRFHQIPQDTLRYVQHARPEPAQDTTGYVPYSPPREGPIHQDTCDTSDFHAPGARTNTRYNGIRCDTFASCLACPAPGPPRYNTIRSLWGGPGQGQIRQDTFRYVAVWSAPSRCGHAWGRLLCTYSKMSVLFLPGASCIQES